VAEGRNWKYFRRFSDLEEKLKIILKQDLSYKVPERSERERGAAPLSNLLFPAGRDRVGAL
jgi:hypothetical protein